VCPHAAFFGYFKRLLGGKAPEGWRPPKRSARYGCPRLPPLIAARVTTAEADVYWEAFRHSFQDFNGRTIRLFLLELLRRLDSPRVVLAVESSADLCPMFTCQHVSPPLPLCSSRHTQNGGGGWLIKSSKLSGLKRDGAIFFPPDAAKLALKNKMRSAFKHYLPLVETGAGPSMSACQHVSMSACQQDDGGCPNKFKKSKRTQFTTSVNKLKMNHLTPILTKTRSKNEPNSRQVGTGPDHRIEPKLLGRVFRVLRGRLTGNLALPVKLQPHPHSPRSLSRTLALGEAWPKKHPRPWGCD